VDWSTAHDWLIANDFFPRDGGEEGPPTLYLGHLATKYGRVGAEITLDSKGINFPLVRLLKRPGWLPSNCAHLGDDLTLCCTDRSTSAPDRRYPLAQVQGVVERAKLLLEGLVESGGHSSDEFVRLWGGLSSSAMGYLPSTSIEPEQWHIVDAQNESGWPCLAPASRVGAARKWLGSRSSNSCLTPIRLSITGTYRATGPGWPIRCVKDLQDWVEYIDPSAAERLKALLASLARRIATNVTRDRRLLVILHHGDSDLAILFDLAHYLQWLPKGRRRNAEEAIRQVEQALARQRQDRPGRFRLFNVDAERLIERSIGPNMASLLGKKVVLVGAGSVGSHLGMALVRAGAGSGGGELVVFDPDRVGAENLPRSAYDARHIGLGKADALAQMLRLAVVDLNVSAQASQAPTVAVELAADIVVDASGEHSFSCWLSAECRQGRVGPVLFVWISGQGAAAVTYLQGSASAACLACLGIADAGSEWNPLTNPSEAASHQLGSCGESFMPYSVSAPMVAAGLALTHTLDWARDPEISGGRSLVLAPDRARAVPTAAPSCNCP
jgi:hypothetical protein